jgi:hypothetical protein
MPLRAFWLFLQLLDLANVEPMTYKSQCPSGHFGYFYLVRAAG